MVSTRYWLVIAWSNSSDWRRARCIVAPRARRTFALRSYLPDGHPDKDREIGSEPTPEAFLATMVAVFREVWRVLRDDGYMFVNLGDGYWGGKGQNGTSKALGNASERGYTQSRGTVVTSMRAQDGKHDTLKSGDQILMPHRVALALQADGWILRDTVIWSKKSPMPQSVNGSRWSKCRVKVAGHDRGNQDWSNSTEGRPQSDARHGGPYDGAKYIDCPGCDKCRDTGGYVLRRGSGRTCTSHEYCFLFVKRIPYFWDMENCREACSLNTHSKGTNKHHKNGKVGRERTNASFQDAIADKMETRIPRSVLTLSSEPVKFAHFATFPSALVKFMLNPLSPKGCCPVCGEQWAPVVETSRTATRPGNDSKVGRAAAREGSVYEQHSGTIVGNRDPQRHQTQTRVLEYRPTCNCGRTDAVPATVLDPFSGLGTTGQTAMFLGHSYIGIELIPEYAELSEQWIQREPRWSLRGKQASGKGKRKKKRDGLVQGELFG